MYVRSLNRAVALPSTGKVRGTRGLSLRYGTFFRLLILSGFCNISRCCGDRESGWWFQLRQSTRLHLQVPFLYHRLLDGFPVEPRIHCVPELRNVCLWILCWHLSENGRCQCESPPKIDPEVHGLLQIRVHVEAVFTMYTFFSILTPISSSNSRLPLPRTLTDAPVSSKPVTRLPWMRTSAKTRGSLRSPSRFPRIPGSSG
ncbi:uncharacterized protein [Drosophila kikkawai]|uniref:Uncharacterized protein n=1 Tax=Drosophila kikkawai TaxID=30033 RepID=A0ABM4GFZ4_DROKI